MNFSALSSPSSPLVIVASDISLTHITGLRHPESPQRYAAIIAGLLRSGMPKNAFIQPRRAERSELFLCHTPEYVDLVEKEVAALQKGELRLLSTGDVVISEQSYEAALFAVGAALVGVDEVFVGKAQRAFCIVRPPGHHACSNIGMGFCLFNNVAIACRYAMKRYGIRKALIVDWDVHHGNGTQEIFDQDPTVFYFSTHQAGIYPGTGLEDDVGIEYTKMNCTIQEGPKAREDIIKAFEEKLLPAMEKFQPECIFISAGFDAHIDDPIGGLNLVEDDFARLTKLMLELANTYAKGRIISVLEGGYHLSALTSCVLTHIQALMQEM